MSATKRSSWRVPFSSSRGSARGRDVTRVAEALMVRRIPMVFQSELDLPPNLQQLCPDVPFYKRPAPPRLLVEKLAQLIRPGAPVTAQPGAPPPPASAQMPDVPPAAAPAAAVEVHKL